MKRSFWLLAVGFVLLSLIAGMLAAPAAAQTDPTPLVLVMTMDGPLTPAMVEYLNRGIRTAEERGAEALIVELNTPGGSINLMNEMVTAILASQVPVVVYVAPGGAMAGSAGTMITLAGQIAAMAPETMIGAASPIGSSGQDLSQTAEAKEKNAMKATIRSLTERRPAAATSLAEEMIDSAKAVSASEALDVGLVDFIARDINDLLSQMDGFPVVVQGERRALDTARARVEDLPSTFIEKLLGTLTDPNITFLLLNLGVAAILIEIASPGGWVAGFIGTVALALGVFGLGVLPVNWFGLIFLLVAFALFILDIKAPTHGALTLAGVGSLIIGALVLFNTSKMPGFEGVSVPLVVTSSLLTGGMFFGILIFAVRAQSTPLRMGQESLLGRVGTVTVDLAPRGQVRVGGEIWTAEAEEGTEPLPRGTRVQVISLQGLKLLVRKAE